MGKTPRARSGGAAKREPNGRVPLTPAEIYQLDAALMRAFQTIEELRREYPAAKHIKYPSIPSVYSESLVIASAQSLFGNGWKARYGGSLCDILLEDDLGANRRVEVKATAYHAFQEFKAKDLQADILVWVRFGKRFQVGSGPIEIVVLESPGRLIKSACRLDKVRFEKLVVESPGLSSFRFNSLEELLPR